MADPQTPPAPVVSPLEVRLQPRLSRVKAADWDALLPADSPPFLKHAWLNGLELTGCAVEEKGWIPQHITIWKEDRLVAAMPLYLKLNSEGEFVFDFGWAHAADRAGIPYYPKVLSAIPFTPATGPRLLVAPDQPFDPLARLLVDVLQRLTRDNDLSGAHALFLTEREAALFEGGDFAERLGIQYHWVNRGYQSWDDFLLQFNSKRRHQLKRERREVEASGIQTRTHFGETLGEHELDVMYQFYLAQLERYAHWSRQYLNRDFFSYLREHFSEHLEIVLAYDQMRPIAGALNIRSPSRLYGRYWGAIDHRPFLHFHVCYYHSIEQCIGRGVQVFEPGAGGEHKRPRGFEPTLTRSAHYLARPEFFQAIRRFLARERLAIQTELQSLSE